ARSVLGLLEGEQMPLRGVLDVGEALPPVARADRAGELALEVLLDGLRDDVAVGEAPLPVNDARVEHDEGLALARLHAREAVRRPLGPFVVVVQDPRPGLVVLVR